MLNVVCQTKNAFNLMFLPWLALFVFQYLQKVRKLFFEKGYFSTTFELLYFYSDSFIRYPFKIIWQNHLCNSRANLIHKILLFGKDVKKYLTTG